MNIFYVHRDPTIAAKMLCDKHVVKMILESAQMLSTAHHEFGSVVESMYKRTHVNHPSNVWVRQSHQHYNWLWAHAMALCEEYTERYGKVHKSQAIIERLVDVPRGLPSGCFVDPPRCMPDEYKTGDTVESYRRYYIGDKAYMATWKQNKPTWFNH